MKFQIIDYPQSNAVSVQYWLHRNRQQAVLYSQNPDVAVDAFVLPGVGAYDRAMDFIARKGLAGRLREAVLQGKLVIGICLGMQLFFVRSEEGEAGGLGLMPGHVRRLLPGPRKVPNIGWRAVHKTEQDTGCGVNGPLSVLDGGQFYFMHGYAIYLDEIDPEIAAGANILSGDCNRAFVAAFRYQSIIGFQFHPEKSFVAGDVILQRVIEAHGQDPSSTPCGEAGDFRRDCISDPGVSAQCLSWGSNQHL